MPNSQNNSSQNRIIGEMMGNSISRPPTQQVSRPAIPAAQNGIGTTSVSEPPAPQPTGPIPGSVGAGQIAKPPAPAPDPGTKGLGSNQIATPPQQQVSGDEK